jgi:hypothetical protein
MKQFNTHKPDGFYQFFPPDQARAYRNPIRVPLHVLVLTLETGVSALPGLVSSSSLLAVNVSRTRKSSG